MRNDRQEHSFHGPVKSVYVESAELEEQDGELVERPWSSHTMTFNKDGSIIKTGYQSRFRGRLLTHRRRPVQPQPPKSRGPGGFA